MSAKCDFLFDFDPMSGPCRANAHEAAVEEFKDKLRWKIKFYRRIVLTGTELMNITRTCTSILSKQDGPRRRRRVFFTKDAAVMFTTDPRGVRKRMGAVRDD